MSRLVDIDNYLVLENGTIKETSFKQDIQIQNQTLMINEDAKVQIIYKTTEEGTYQFNIEIKDRLHVDLVEMYEASKSCSYTKNIKINESSEVLRYVEKNSHQNIQLDLDENVDVYKYARVSCAYVELTDYITLSKIKYRLLEEEASAKLRLASLSKEKENKHYEMTLEHLAPHTYGDMDNYGIVKSKASLLIDGIGRIHKGMYQSDTHQTNKIIVFDEAKYEAEKAKITIVKPGTVYKKESGMKYLFVGTGYSLRTKIRDIYAACRVSYQQGSSKSNIEATYTVTGKKGKTLQVNEQVESVAEALNLAKKRLREKNKDEVTGSLNMLGNFGLLSGVTVNLLGFGAFDDKYLITRASHDIGSGYTTNIDVRRCLNGY